MNQWTNEWPTEPGHYWLYGYPFAKPRPDDKPRMQMMEVKPIRNGLTYISHGAFVWRQTAGPCVFQKADVPSPPPEFPMSQD